MAKPPKKAKKPSEVRKANEAVQKSSGRPRGRPKKGDEVQYETVEVSCPKKVWVSNPGYGYTGMHQETCPKCDGTGKLLMKKRKS